MVKGLVPKFTVRPSNRNDIKLESVKPLENQICIQGDVLRWRFLQALMIAQVQHMAAFFIRDGIFVLILNKLG